MDLIFQLPLVPQLQDLLLLFFLQPRSSCRITAAATLFTLFFLSTTSSYAQQQTSSSSCSQTWIRREIRELIDTATTNQLLPDGQAFFDGVKCLMRLPGISGSGSVSVWDDFTLTHLNNVATAHGKKNKKKKFRSRRRGRGGGGRNLIF